MKRGAVLPIITPAACHAHIFRGEHPTVWGVCCMPPPVYTSHAGAGAGKSSRLSGSPGEGGWYGSLSLYSLSSGPVPPRYCHSPSTQACAGLQGGASVLDDCWEAGVHADVPLRRAKRATAGACMPRSLQPALALPCSACMHGHLTAAAPPASAPAPAGQRCRARLWCCGSPWQRQ